MFAAIKKALWRKPKGHKNTPHVQYTPRNPEFIIQQWLDNILKEAKTKWS